MTDRALGEFVATLAAAGMVQVAPDPATAARGWSPSPHGLDVWPGGVQQHRDLLGPMPMPPPRWSLLMTVRADGACCLVGDEGGGLSLERVAEGHGDHLLGEEAEALQGDGRLG
jgi:hypothetical protein